MPLLVTLPAPHVVAQHIALCSGSLSTDALSAMRRLGSTVLGALRRLFPD